MLNVVVHRDYKNVSDIVIKVFDDRIVITNPGKLYGKLTLDELSRNDYTSSLRNRLIAEAFYLTGDIERYGTGFVRIREFLLSYPEVTFAIDEKGDFFWVELRLNSDQITPQVTPQVELLLGAIDRPSADGNFKINWVCWIVNIFAKNTSNQHCNLVLLP